MAFGEDEPISVRPIGVIGSHVEDTTVEGDKQVNF